MLTSVHILFWCNNILNVSKLSSVHELLLYNCFKISDVSNLGSVHTLDLSYCTKIKDIGNLKVIKIIIQLKPVLYMIRIIIQGVNVKF